MSEWPSPRQPAQPVETVACLGSSTTASKGTYKWIGELENRPQNSRFRFVNLGVGGDLSFNTVRLLDRVVAVRPDRVIVLIGTNDILARVFPNFRRVVRVWKRLSEEPSPARFEENLDLVVRRLQQDANARIGLSSLAPLGEELHSCDHVQAQLNELVATYNGIIRKVASAGQVDYIPFYEAFEDQLLRAETAKPLTHFSFASFYRDYLFRETILRQRFDQISRLNGWEFHIDGVHLNTKGGRILTEAVQQF
jgi:lysophospholipase L1-like esterase